MIKVEKCPDCGELCEWVDNFPICEREECPSNQFGDAFDEEDDEVDEDDEDTDEFASDTGDEDEV
jgi:hypothetical protein